MENLKNTKLAFSFHKKHFSFFFSKQRKKDDAGETYWLKKTQGTLKKNIYRQYIDGICDPNKLKKIMYKVNVKHY